MSVAGYGYPLACCDIAQSRPDPSPDFTDFIPLLAVAKRIGSPRKPQFELVDDLGTDTFCCVDAERATTAGGTLSDSRMSMTLGASVRLTASSASLRKHHDVLGRTWAARYRRGRFVCFASASVAIGEMAAAGAHLSPAAAQPKRWISSHQKREIRTLLADAPLVVSRRTV